MFGWMPLKDKSFVIPSPKPRAVVPTALIPLTFIGVVVSAAASFIAGFFGLKLMWEGPKRLLEILLKPRVLATIFALNLGLWGAFELYSYLSHMPKPSFFVQWQNRHNLEATNRLYTDAPQTMNAFRFPSKVPPPATIHQMAQVWERKLEGGAFGEITFSGESLFVGTKGGYVYEFDRHSGEEVRRFYVGTFVTPTPIIWNRRLYVGEGTHSTHHARIYSFDLDSGELVATFTTAGHTEGVPVIATHDRHSLLFATAGQDGLYALNPLTLEPVWHQKIGHVDSEVRVVNGKVIFSTGLDRDNPRERPFAMALDFLTGTISWKRELVASGWRAPVVLSDRVCFSLGEVFFASHFGQLACFDSANGTPLSAINFEEPLIGIPRAIGQYVLTSDLQGKVCLSDPSQSRRLWCRQSENQINSYASATIDPRGFLLYPTVNAGIMTIDLESGQVLSLWKPKDNQAPWDKVMSSVGSDGQNLFVVSWNGILRKLSL